MSSKLCQSGLDDAERDRAATVDVAVEGAQASRASILSTSVWESEEDDRKVAGACSEALHRLKTTSTAGEGGPVSQRTPQMDSKASLMVQSTIEQAWLTWEGGQVRMTYVGKLGEGGYSLQMRVARLAQQHQRLLELGNPALEHLFTEGGRANRAAKAREPLTGDRDLRWQWGERRNAALAGQRGGTCLR